MNSDTRYTVAVRTLCEFTAKSGDLDLRFTPSPTAKEGMAGHAQVTARRPADYEREISLSGTFKQLEVRGRADGFDPTTGRLDEIKTYRGDLALQPDNHRALHWAQALVYASLLCEERDLPELEVALVYFDIVTQKETLLTQQHSRDELKAVFEQHCQAFLQWAEQEAAHRQARDGALEALSFPHSRFRQGQRTLAEAVFQSASRASCLLAEAPTGIGKTLGTLFPLLKAMPRKDLDKILFLTAKTPGRALALDTLHQLDAQPLRVLELVARDKSCEHPDKACHGDSCPLAQGFYDRLPAARQAAAQQSHLDHTSLRNLARQHQICPYYLSQEMARWADVIVADYNYFFDISAMLHALVITEGWRAAVLVDEAHNLVDRARSSYSAELDQPQFRALKKQAPAALKRAFDKLNRQWNQVNKDADDAAPEADYLPQTTLPSAYLFALQQLTAAVTDYLTEQPFGLDTHLMRFYFDALHFLRVAELYDEATFVFDLRWTDKASAKGGKSRTKRKASRLCIRNLVPAAMLRERFDSAAATTLFSATFKPAHYYVNLLGLPANTQYLEVPAPFVAEQLEVHIASEISTRYRDRAASVGPIVQLIAQQYAQRPGNYLAFFSSYDYLNQVLERLHAEHPGLPVWAQNKQMDEAARQAFIAQFQSAGRGVGFAVLGGAFGEAIDLAGDRLIGAFIATLGLPQANPANELLKYRMATLFGDGYNYAYLYPGLRKVVQAAGRVIRTESDTGVVHLIDDRFNEPRVRRLLPSWWALE